MRKRHRLLILAVGVLVTIAILGMFYFKWAEGWSFVDAIYFTAMTITTIGYGDLVPSHNASKIIASIYAVISIPLALFAFGVIAEEYIEIRISKLEKKMTDIVRKNKEMEKDIEENEEKIEENIE